MKPSLLVVDDDVFVLELLRDILGSRYPVVALTSPRSAMLINPFNLLGLVTDWRMNELSGLVLVRKMRRIRPDLPVVIVSGEISQVMKELCELPDDGEYGNVKLVPKPFEIDTLLDAVREATKTRVMENKKSGTGE